jgi:hypothetical protein
MTILDLKECFLSDNVGGSSSGAFLKFLAHSNHPEIVKVKEQKKDYLRHIDDLGTPVLDKCKEIEVHVLNEILEILLKEPEADYFWYGYPEQGSKFSYSLPHHDVVPSGSLRVDKEKIKSFLRNCKLEKLGI